MTPFMLQGDRRALLNLMYGSDDDPYEGDSLYRCPQCHHPVPVTMSMVTMMPVLGTCPHCGWPSRGFFERAIRVPLE